jgi:hypothetical protein
MPIFDLYSKRKKASERSGQPDVYQYESIPENVANQIAMILSEAIGDSEQYWAFIINAIAREYGDPSVGIWPTSRDSCMRFLRKDSNIDSKLDLIELSFKLIDKGIRGYELMNPLIFAGTHIGQTSWTNDVDREFHPSEA